MKFGKKGTKLSPWYVGPSKILDRIGEVAYRFALPPQFANVHNVFHVSMLKKYHFDPSHVIDFGPLHIQDDWSFIEKRIQILDQLE